MPTLISRGELLARYSAGDRRFQTSILDGIDLSGCSLDGIELVQCSIKGANLAGSSFQRSYLGDCDLRNANLTDAVFHYSSPHSVDFSGANLSRASFKGGSFVGSNFSNATLSKANFMGVHIQDVPFKAADLRSADFQTAKILNVDFSEALCDGLVLSRTVLSAIDVAPFCSATVEHRGPSIVDHRTIVKSRHHPRIREFLRATGMPEVFIEFTLDCARALSPLEEFRLFQSVFISYGGPDFAFAQKLHSALEAQGVRSFFFPLDAVFGEGLDEMMHHGVNDHDRVVLLCSEASLLRRGVINEISESLRREARAGGVRCLIPVALDQYVFDGWDPQPPSVKVRVLDRVVADFTQAASDDQVFTTQVGRLVAALRKSEPHSSG